MKPEDKQLLVAIVAAHEVLFEPFRWKGGDSNVRILGAIATRRRECRTSGLPWTVGGDGATRQAGYLSLKRLQSSGLIQIHKSRTVQRTGISLRRLEAILPGTPNPTLNESWTALELVAKAEASPGTRSNEGGFVMEHDVLGLPHTSTDGKPSSKFVTLAMPLIVAGYLESATDARGLLGWRLTPSGRDALQTGPPEHPDDALEYDSEMGELYNQLVASGLRERQGWKSENGDLGIPLSAGLWLTRAEWQKYNERQGRRDEH